MSPTIEECLEHARQCEWYAARTKDEELITARAQRPRRKAQPPLGNP